MPSSNSSESSPSSTSSGSSSSDIDFNRPNTTLLAIAAVLYNDLLHPRRLTPKHIAALRIYTPYNDESLSSIETSVHAIKSETAFLIRQARELDARHNSQMAESEETSEGEWELAENVDPFEFGKCLRAWIFMQVMEREGESSQRQFLLNGWEAFDELPVELKCWVELRRSNGGDPESTDDAEHEWEME